MDRRPHAAGRLTMNDQGLNVTERSHDKHESGSGGKGRWVFLGFVLIAGYFLLTEHRAHAVQFLPFALLLACPLLHMFHGHGGHGGGDRRDKTDERPGP
jgi:hypothetical protein